MRQTLLVLVALLLPSFALADAPPLRISVVGRLLDANDVPVEGQVTLTFGIYTTAGDAAGDNTAPVWTASWTRPLARGTYAFQLGDKTDDASGGTLLTTAVFDGSPRWIGVKVGQVELRPRHFLGTVPMALVADRALRADTAKSAETLGNLPPSAFAAAGHDHDATYLKIADAAATYQPKGAYLKEADRASFQPAGNYLAEADRASFQPAGSYLKEADRASFQPAGSYVTTTEAAAFLKRTEAVDAATLQSKRAADFAAAAHTHAAADIASGKLDIARIPTGPGSNLDADTVDGIDGAAIPKWRSTSGTVAPGASLTLTHATGGLAGTNDVIAMGWWADASGVYHPHTEAVPGGGFATDASLVGYWSFDDCTARDLSPNGNHGVLVNTPQCVAGRFGNAMKLNGATSFIRVPDSTSVRVQRNLTMAAWVSVAASCGTECIVFNRENTYETSIQGLAYKAAISPTSCGNWFWSGNGTVSTQQWAFVVTTYDGVNYRNFVNGQLVETVGASGGGNFPTAACGTYDLGIGARGVVGTSGSSFFNGTIDEAAIFSRVLSQAEISSMYVNGMTSSSPLLLTQPNATSVQLTNTSTKPLTLRLAVVRP